MYLLVPLQITITKINELNQRFCRTLEAALNVRGGDHMCCLLMTGYGILLHHVQLECTFGSERRLL